ncbi:hypothetical protein [Burkholderia ubonensis]|uniref:hypothetical protein n=1 Tax=Burkholderia ubonensis TaxID=101571 RepID=UPI000A864B69|nr:hypothetical protein [Burkholderia ubonensis]
MKREEHPVWAVYDKLRTARLNVKYYSARLDRFEQLNRILEITLLVTAPTSAVAGLWLFQTVPGTYVWHGLAGLSAVIATVRPVFQMTNKIKAYEATISAYRTLEYDLETIRQKIEHRGVYDDKLQSEFLKALERQKQADAGSPERVPNDRIRHLCTQEVLSEMPVNSFFVPET